MSSADTDEAAVPARRVGPYRLVRELGRGGMGIVHLADAPDGRRVAIKIINSEMTETADFRERFRREVTAARQVRSFCTAPVLDANMDGEPFYVVTEYIQGPTLERIVSSHGPLTGSDLDGLAVGVATALAAIHSAGVVHRDLKPENILLSPFGPRVIDFGIARRLGTDHRITRAGQSMGTPAFMAPEGLVDKPITAAADVFSWGSVIAYAGTGRLAFHGENVGQVLYKTVYGEPRLDGLKQPLRDIVARTMAKDPAMRPTAAQLLEELTGQSDTERAARSVGRVGPTVPSGNGGSPSPTPALPPSSDGFTRYFTDKRKSRRRLVLGGAGAALALTVALTAILWPDSDGGSPAASPTRSLGGSPGGGLQDDFSDANSGWETGHVNEEFELYRDGSFTVSHVSGGSYRVQRAPVSALPENVEVTATVRVDSPHPADEAGVYCRGGGDMRYDVLLMRSGLVRIRKGDSRSGTELARTASPAVTPPGTAARVTAVCAASGAEVEVKALIDGQQVAAATDGQAPLPAGAIGLVTGREERLATDAATRATFDDFTLGRP
ncbi:serine/threonine-protein kinase [Actinomadura sp. 7K534]|uniref:serine/threonine-protein kinase n=1 Tax=Actinomadura sp. 7K534 TaxID=2530366 RepID=UPI00104C4D84|nr:serine/threonine-protein kinase [Actinomadura sp. 7K534]TDB87971.1 serine/threonine protein kinase [Actinomadura sp. 7K534]